MIRQCLAAGLVAIPLFFVFMTHGIAQDSDLVEREGFSSGDAILDTSIPFSTDAREARQSLRGSFGWETYQEGSVGGIFYRFDPDGFARFSTSPRLDENVFEVNCEAEVYECVAHKQGLKFSVDTFGGIIASFDAANLRSQFSLFDGAQETSIDLSRPTELATEMAQLFLNAISLRARNGTLETVEIDLRSVSQVYDYINWVATRQGKGRPNPPDVRLLDPNEISSTEPTVTFRNLSPSPNTPGASELVRSATQKNSDELRTELGQLRDLILQQNAMVPEDHTTSLAPSVSRAARTQSLPPMRTAHTTEGHSGAVHDQLDVLEAVVLEMSEILITLQADVRALKGTTGHVTLDENLASKQVGPSPKRTASSEEDLINDPELLVSLLVRALGNKDSAGHTDNKIPPLKTDQTTGEFMLLEDYVAAQN